MICGLYEQDLFQISSSPNATSKSSSLLHLLMVSIRVVPSMFSEYLIEVNSTHKLKNR